jgi:hypothetical protein
MRFKCGQLEIDTDTEVLGKGNRMIMRATNELTTLPTVIELVWINPANAFKHSDKHYSYQVLVDQQDTEGFHTFVEALGYFHEQCTIHSEY